MPMKATINDVARHAGVSKATVSRVLNGHQNVARSLQDRVIASMKQLDYQPSAVARDLSVGRTRLIGALLPDVASEHHALTLRGLEDSASRSDYLIVLRNTDGHSGRERESLLRLLGQNVAGIALIGAQADKESMQPYLKSGVPLVLCNQQDGDSQFDCAFVDEAGMARNAVHYLMALGHTRICYLSGLHSCGNPAIREDAYRATMKSNGLFPWVFGGIENFESGVRGIGRTLAGDAPSAFIASDGEIAAMALEAAHKNGLDVPGDVSLLSLCENSRQGAVQGFLTSLSIPAYELGCMAGDMLIDRIRGKHGKPEQKMIRASLQLRDSCAPPRADLLGAQSFVVEAHDNS